MSLAQPITDETASDKISITNVVGHNYFIVSRTHSAVHMRDRSTDRTQKIKEESLAPVCFLPPMHLDSMMGATVLFPCGTKGFPGWFAPP